MIYYIRNIRLCVCTYIYIYTALRT